jgi:hypothetical protein
MTRFEFLEFFGPQLIFIGEWGTKFDFLDFFDKKIIKFTFKRPNSYSNDQI